MKLCAERLTGLFSTRLNGPRILTLAAAPVGRISVEAGDAALAVSAGCQVLALLAHTLVDALAVTVTLTSCQRVNKAHTEHHTLKKLTKKTNKKKTSLINSHRPKF